MIIASAVGASGDQTAAGICGGLTNQLTLDGSIIRLGR